MKAISKDDGNKDLGDTAPVILIVGSCGLDRLLAVSSYPSADAKVRTTSYAEVGGGNSANTATAIGKLTESELFPKQKRLRVQLLSKVGDDAVGQQLIQNLHDSNVETHSSLFRRGDCGSTTSFTTVIVSQNEQTRTCIHTPGSCGELSLEDVQSLSVHEIDRVFRNAVHLHSDSRHTAVSLWMAREAKKRGITVSCDCEKDRATKDLDELIDICDILFTNSSCLEEYLQRLTGEREKMTGRAPFPEPTIIMDEWATESIDKSLVDIYVKSLNPSAYFARWQPRLGKEVVITHGSVGSLHYKPLELHSTSSDSSRPQNTIQIDMEDRDNPASNICIRHSFHDGKVGTDVLYEVHQAGVLKDVTVVDTTGAGDAFIGGYLLSRIVLDESQTEKTESIGSDVQFALEVGSFVAGRKLGGPGAQSALPSSGDFDRLGSNVDSVKSSLRKLVGSFHHANEKIRK